MPLNLTSFKVLAFDVMGTLVDELRGLDAACAPLRARLNLKQSDLHSHLEGFLRSQMASTPTAPYSQILALAYVRLAEHLSNGEHFDGVEAEAQAFADSLLTWPAFPDTLSSLDYLSQFFKLVPISNMDSVSLAHICSDKGQLAGAPFAARLTSDVMGGFKPSHAAFQSLIKLAQIDFNVSKSEILIVAQGLYTDMKPAAELGLASAWIDRYGQGMNAIQPPAKPDWVFTSLEELVQEHRKAVAA